ncbi:MAG: type II toxin-antitoxin system VapC family toxin [Chamaesiphon sp.]|nr:type II toxin-antitoxin system VapC family toxin [Chamaesiphon sp.]
MSVKYLLDTNIFSELMRPAPNPKIVKIVDRCKAETATASTVIHELLYGCLRLPESNKRQAFMDYINDSVLNLPIIDYDSNAAQLHAQERARLSKIGKTLAFADGQIASIAASNDLILVTNNVADFQYFDSLKIENWFESGDNS